MGRTVNRTHRSMLEDSYYGSTAAPILNPADLSLTGWWRGSFASVPWAGTASAGSSGSRPLDLGTASVGSALNSLDAASFNGTSQSLTCSTVTADGFLSTTGYRLSFLVLINSLAAPSGTIYADKGLLTESGGNWGIVANTDGVNCFHHDGAYKVAVKSITAGAWHAVDIIYNGTNLIVSVDGTAGTPVAAGTLSSITGATFRICDNLFGSGKLGCQIEDLAVANTALATTTASAFKAYYNSRYALSL